MPTPISQSGWSLLYVDSEELAAENGAGINAIDGDTNTRWVTKWSSMPVPPHPHDYVVDLGAGYNLAGFRYLHLATGGANGRIGQYAFYVKADTGPPTIPPVQEEWVQVATGAFPNTSGEKEVLFASQVGRYVWLRALDEAQGVGHPWTTMAELNVLGTPYNVFIIRRRRR